MAPLRNLLNRWCQALTAMPLEDLQSARDFAADAAKVLQTASLQAVTEIAENASYLIAPGSTLMTHSMSSTLVACCRVLKSRGLRMIVTESRPLYEGRRLAQLLSQWGVITTLITEAQMGLFVREADVVLIGADSVLTDGAVVNKVGTHLLALAAHEQQVPFYVCCESFKFHGQGDRARIDLEEMEPAELGFDAPEPITVRNVYFETTPARLVTGWITEVGVIDSWGKPPCLGRDSK